MRNININYQKIWHCYSPAIDGFFAGGLQNDAQPLLSKDVAPHRSSVAPVTDYKGHGNRPDIRVFECQVTILTGRIFGYPLFPGVVSPNVSVIQSYSQNERRLAESIILFVNYS